jgi:uncharacterized UPF0160 family protein
MKINFGRQLSRSLLPATKRDLEKFEQKLMSKFTEWADAEDADIAGIKDLLTGIAAGIVNLDKLITDFQNSPGDLSAADQQRADAIQAATKELRALAAGISTVPPGATPAPTTP